LTEFKHDERILLWDIYNEPGQFGIGDNSIALLEMVWEWAQEIRPKQPLTACLDGSVGSEIIECNRVNSDIITFHTYEGEKLQETIDRLASNNRPMICTEYMAREFGSTFEFSLPIFKENNIGCYNWGLVAGKSQTHFSWSTILDLKKKKEEGDFVEEGESIPEPEVWFHDILRTDGTPFDESEINFIKDRPGHDIRYALNSNKIKKELNWKPKTTFSEGIKLTFEWYKNNKKYYKSLKRKDIINRLGTK